jgi:hypothetical protein
MEGVREPLRTGVLPRRGLAHGRAVRSGALRTLGGPMPVIEGVRRTTPTPAAHASISNGGTAAPFRQLESRDSLFSIAQARPSC